MHEGISFPLIPNGTDGSENHFLPNDLEIHDYDRLLSEYPERLVHA